MRRCSGFAFPQIATGDLDIAVVSQLPPPNLPLGDEFEMTFPFMDAILGHAVTGGVRGFVDARFKSRKPGRPQF